MPGLPTRGAWLSSVSTDWLARTFATNLPWCWRSRPPPTRPGVGAHNHVRRQCSINKKLGLGLTIAGATFSELHPTTYFQNFGVPLAIDGHRTSPHFTLGPAIIAVTSRSASCSSLRGMARAGLRKVGAAIVRWPGPIRSGRWFSVR